MYCEAVLSCGAAQSWGGNPGHLQVVSMSVYSEAMLQKVLLLSNDTAVRVLQGNAFKCVAAQSGKETPDTSMWCRCLCIARQGFRLLLLSLGVLAAYDLQGKVY